MLSPRAKCSNRWHWITGISARCLVGVLLLVLPCRSLAEEAPSANQFSPPAYTAGQEPPLEGIDATQESGDDLDPNLIPLEPELSASPPDLSSGDASVETPSPEATASAGPSGPQETLYNIPVVIDQSVQSHIRFFNTSIRDRFEQWLVRFNRYRPLVDKIFAEFNLPSDLVHLSLVESGFNPYAYSRAKATGPWQFMKGTGKLYGLRIDHYVDERRDPIKSTVAAARYLRDLYDIFGTWPLAMAAYNAGEGKVLRALQKAQAESFSDISRTKLIRVETKQYVPRIMAATIIARNPDQYGFTQNPVPPHEFEEVIVTRSLHFRAISNVTGIPYNDLRLLNPELRRDATPPDEVGYHLKVPVGMRSKVVELLERVPTHKFPPMSMMADRDVSRPKVSASHWYRVRMGDTLQKISRKFGIPIKVIKSRNNISGPVIRAGELLNLAR